MGTLNNGSVEKMLDDVNCNGIETSLFDCQHNSLELHNCVSREGAGVNCIGLHHIGQYII